MSTLSSHDNGVLFSNGSSPNKACAIFKRVDFPNCRISMQCLQNSMSKTDDLFKWQHFFTY